MSGVALSPDAPAIRLCHVVKWADYEGFGFNLHSEKSKPGQYLGKIDDGSPAQLAGLREGDRIVEVNGINISNENHKQVVERIKAVPNETKLLVVDPLADTWYKEHKIIIKNSLPTVKQCHNPVPRPGKKNSGASVGSDSSSQQAAAKAVVHLPAGAPSARLCHLVRRADFDGYGFNLHADKQRKLQYVGAVDPGSPAEAAGLRANDTIVEVNGANVEGANHRDIVERIKSVPNETRLLVVDDGTAAWYKEHGVAIRGDLPNVIQLSSVKAAARRASKGVATPPAATAATATSASPSQASTASESAADGLRLCQLCKWPNFDGYGFNLHADKKRQGHFIGQVDAGSPAELGGLRKNDRLVEVNGLSVEGESHREIIDRIKQDPSRVELLVVDRETDEAFARRKVKPSSQAPEVARCSTPAQQPGTDTPSKQHQGSSTAPVTSGGRDPVTNGSPRGGKAVKPPSCGGDEGSSSAGIFMKEKGSTGVKRSPSVEGVSLPLKLTATCSGHELGADGFRLAAKPQREKKVGRSGASKAAPNSEQKPGSGPKPPSVAVSKSEWDHSETPQDSRLLSQGGGVNGASKESGAAQPAGKPERRDESKPKPKPPPVESFRFSTPPTSAAPPSFPPPPRERDGYGRYLDGVAADATGWSAYQQPPWPATDPFPPPPFVAQPPYAMPPLIPYPPCVPYQPVGLLWSPLLPVAYQPLPYQPPFVPFVPSPNYPSAYQPVYPDLYTAYSSGSPVQQYANSVPTAPGEPWGQQAPNAVPHASETARPQGSSRRSAGDPQKTKQGADDTREPSADDKGSGQNSTKS